MFNTFLDILTVPPAGYSCSASGENVYGRKGAGGMDIPGEPVVEDAGRIGQVTELADPHPARELGQKWKVRPWIYLDPNVETPLLDTDGPGVVRHIWITLEKKYFRSIIIRMYWDNEATPSVAVPLGDFFCNAPVYGGDMQSLAFCVNPDNAMNCYLPMPFRKHARITVEWLGAERLPNFYYTVNFTKEPVADDALYLHASFRRENPVKYGNDFTIVDGIKGKGSFAGVYMTWQQNNNGWWGEGEIKMFVDGDGEFPSICGTGTEDYFCGAWSFRRPFSSPYSGYIGTGDDKIGNRHALYRFHIADPVWFHEDLKVTMQAIGWRSNGRFLPLQDDISATAYWYQNEPHAPLAELPDANGLEII